jgi:transcriptional regulator with XRE-family HTH domain
MSIGKLESSVLRADCQTAKENHRSGMEIADEIRRRMRLLGFRPERLSLAAGLNKSYVQDILSGRARSPKLDNLTKLAAALRCSVEELIGQDPPRREGQTDPELLRQALAVATRITAEEDDPATRAEATAAIAAAIYDVLIERSQSGRSLGDETEVIEAMIRRMLRDDRETGFFAAIQSMIRRLRRK